MNSITLKQAQSSAKKRDVLWTVLIIDPIAIPLTWVFAKYPNISPNVLTLFSLFLGITSAYFFSLGKHEYLILGAIIFQLSFLFDCIDGKLARATNRETEIGKKLEFIRDKTTHMLNLAALTYGQYTLSQDIRIIYASFVYFALLFIYWLLYRSPLFKKYDINNNFLTFKRINLLPTSVETMAIIFFLAPLFNKIYEGLVIACYILAVLLLYRFFFILPLTHE